MKKSFRYGADMGSFKIMSKDMSCFFENNFGDGDFEISIYDKEKEIKNSRDMDFKGHFTCNGNCYLMRYDCSEFKDSEKIYKFPKGRWFVSVDKEYNSHVYKCDDETHS